MENFEFMSPTKFIFENDADLRIGEQVKLKSDNVLFVHYGDDFTYKSGLRDRIANAFVKSDVTLFELPGVEPNPKVSLVRKGIDLCKENNIGYVVAVGGGSVIDTAKAIAIGALYDGDVWDFYTHKSTPEKALPIGVVMTLPATGSEASNGSVITNAETGENLDVMTDLLRPTFALLNPQLTLGIPARQTGFGIIDMFSHVVERYMTSSHNVDLTDRMGEAVMQSIVFNGHKVMKNLSDVDARSDLMWAAIVAHNGVVGVGRNQDWATHAIGAQLSATYNTVHGAALSVIMPNWAEYVMEDNVERFAQFAVRVFNVDYDFENPRNSALAGIQAMRDFFSAMGGPKVMADIGIENDDQFEKMAADACRFGNIGGIKSLNKEDIVAIYKKSV